MAQYLALRLMRCPAYDWGDIGLCSRIAERIPHH